MVAPYRQISFGKAVVAGRSAKEKYILFGGTNKISDRLGKELAQPRPTGKDVSVCHYFGDVGQWKALQLAVLEVRRHHGRLLVFASFSKKSFQYELACSSRFQKAAFRFVDSPANPFQT